MSAEKPTRDHVPTLSDCLDGDGMPMLGLGAWKLTDRERAPEAIAEALKMSYRHIDTARRYNNETPVGRGIEQSVVDREDVFLATKVWKSGLSYEDAIELAHAAVDALGVDAVDLLYVHWPAENYDPDETFQAVDDGLTDRIGVANSESEQPAEAVDYVDHEVISHIACDRNVSERRCASRGCTGAG